MKTRQKVLELVRDRASASSSEVAEVLEVTRQTAHHHLTALVRSGDLVQKGKGRATRYFLSPAVALPEVAAQLDEEAEDAQFFGSIGDSLRKRMRADDPLVAVAWALDYRLLPGFDERHEDHGPFGPLWETSDGRHPPPLGEVPDEAVSLWEKLSGLVEHPSLKARLNDLMWERRWSDRPYKYAIAAIKGYLGVAPPVADGMEYVYALTRAAALARQINNDGLHKVAVGDALRRAEAELASVEPMPGIALRMLDVALGDSEEGVRLRVADLLEQAAEVFDDPWIRDDIIDRQLATSSGGLERQRELQRQSVDKWLEHASRHSGMRRRLFLTRALEYARTYGFRDLAEEIRLEVQELEMDEGDIQTISGEVELPSDYIENTIAQIISADTWTNCLNRLLILGPLSGSLRRNTEFVRQMAEQYVFQHLVHPELLGPSNETIFVAGTAEEKAQLELSRHEATAIEMASLIVAEALDDTRASHGMPTKSELQVSFTTPLIDDNTAERIAASIEHYAKERFDECVMVLIPRIEGTIRELVRKIGSPTWSEPRSGVFGKQRSLRTLLAQLRDRLDEDWRRYLIALLVNPLGLNLRNIHMHGLALRGTREQAATLIHAAVYLASLRLSTTGDDDADRVNPDHTTAQPLPDVGPF